MVELVYPGNAPGLAHFDTIKAAVLDASASRKIWSVKTTQSVWDWKRNAGASHTVKRKRAKAGKVSFFWMSCNIGFYGISSKHVRLVFLPGGLLLRRRVRYAFLPYSALDAQYGTTSFIESGRVPRDTRLLYYTWQYVNKNGTADRRFKNNRQIPVVEYGELTLSSANGLHILLQISNAQRGQQLYSALAYP